MTWIREHRLLLVVYGSALALASFELRDPSLRLDRPDDPAVYLDPETNIADVSAALYPDRALSHYYRAFQASLCRGNDFEAGSVCERRGAVKRGEIRELLERAIATGNRSVELALYNYAMVLLQEKAPEEEVEAAIRNWRLNYPGSSRPDPRVAVREMNGR